MGKKQEPTNPLLLAFCRNILPPTHGHRRIDRLPPSRISVDDANVGSGARRTLGVPPVVTLSKGPSRISLEYSTRGQ